jgi:hypothetical protein
VKRITLILCLFLVVPVRAQDARHPAPYTEIERLRIENVGLERVIVQRALDDWRAKVAVVKADLERARPGWTWNPETGEWTATPKS